MAVEILRRTKYCSWEDSYEHSIYTHAQRRSLGRFSGVSFPEAVEIADEVGLGPFDEKEIGKNRILGISHASLMVPDWSRGEKSTFMKLGMAVDFDVDPKTKVRTARAVITRESVAYFSGEDFTYDVERLISYNERLFKLSRGLRGFNAIGAGAGIGAALGLVASGAATGDVVYAGLGMGLGSIFGGVSGYLLAERDQWDVKNLGVEQVDEYFCNQKSLSKLKNIASQIKTVHFINELDRALGDVRLSEDKIKEIWHTDIQLGEFVDRFNAGLNNPEEEDKEGMKQQVLAEMVSYIRGHYWA